MPRTIEITLTERTETIMDDLARRSGLGSNEAVFREALSVYRQIQDMRDEGLQIVIHSACGASGPGYLRVSRAEDAAEAERPARPALQVIEGGLAG